MQQLEETRAANVLREEANVHASLLNVLREEAEAAKVNQAASLEPNGAQQHAKKLKIEGATAAETLEVFGTTPSKTTLRAPTNINFLIMFLIICGISTKLLHLGQKSR